MKANSCEITNSENLVTSELLAFLQRCDITLVKLSVDVLWGSGILILFYRNLLIKTDYIMMQSIGL
jgi:hypothetical protein